MSSERKKNTLQKNWMQSDGKIKKNLKVLQGSLLAGLSRDVKKDNFIFPRVITWQK
jgi:hypothetical protein